jgi:serine/threonine protein kinase
LTCGWLLSEVIRFFPDVSNIIGLRCAERIDVIDMWLQDFERPVGIIKDFTILTPILSQSISENLDLHWFQPISLIGKGGFSEVFLVRKRDTGQLYAMKVMKKNHIIQENKVKNILDECNLLKKIKHPFIITLRWAFQSVRGE